MARSFNGSSDKLTVDTSAISASVQTVCCWFKASTLANSSMVALGNAGDNTTRFRLRLTTSGAISYDSSGIASATSAAAIGTGAWHHAAGASDASAGVRVYLDGVKNVTPGTGTDITCDRMSIGVRHGLSDTDFFAGSLAEVAIWNVALNDGEVMALAKRINPRLVRPGSLVAYYPLYGLASPETDQTAGGRHMTVTGTSLAAHAPVMAFPIRRPAEPTPAPTSTTYTETLSEDGLEICANTIVDTYTGLTSTTYTETLPAAVVRIGSSGISDIWATPPPPAFTPFLDVKVAFTTEPFDPAPNYESV